MRIIILLDSNHPSYDLGSNTEPIEIYDFPLPMKIDDWIEIWDFIDLKTYPEEVRNLLSEFVFKVIDCTWRKDPKGIYQEVRVTGQY